MSARALANVDPQPVTVAMALNSPAATPRKTDGTVGNTTVTPTAALTAAVVKTVAPVAPAMLGTTGD